MYKIQKTMEVSASHQLELDYESPCRNLHGHNYYITVYARCEELNKYGMVIDFAKLKKLVHDRFDHKHLNPLLGCNPTAENMAKNIADSLNGNKDENDAKGLFVYRVDVEETKNNIATWEAD